MARFIFARHPRLEQSWPFVQPRLVERLAALGEVEVVSAERDQALSTLTDLQAVDGVALFGGRLTEDCVARAPRLRMVGCNTDNTGRGLPLDALRERGIPVVDTTRAWGQSVAEVALGLALSALRRIPQWHAELAAGQPSFRYEAGQYCDATGFVNGELGTKRVGVIGLGQIGGRVARWCVALGGDAATGPQLAGEVMGYDPYLPPGLAERWGVQRVDLDTLVERSEVVFVTVPPTPSARQLLDRRRLQCLCRGALLVIVTRAHAVDMAALRERVLAGELAAALDVYDVEPLPVDDPLRGRPNVVHTPHIAGRTRDANLRTAHLIADDFARVLRGEPAQHELTAAAIQARTGEG
ncbi:MAG TPA: NAD(P)-dependent oxidoreductase [Chloroflexota bacterium]|nr:NAD(P)-dependent oxidoreductase [Chloroflexota bacterium]